MELEQLKNIKLNLTVLAGISYLLIRREDLLLTMELLMKVNLRSFLEQERLLTYVVLGYTLDFLFIEK